MIQRDGPDRRHAGLGHRHIICLGQQPPHPLPNGQGVVHNEDLGLAACRLLLLQIFLHLRHSVVVADGRTAAGLQNMGRDHAEGEVPRAADAEQQAGLGRLPLEYPLKLLVGQEIFLLQLIGPQGGEILQHAPHKLPGRVPGGVDEHGVQVLRLLAYGHADGVDEQLFLKGQQDLQLVLVRAAAIDQAVIDALPEFLPAIDVADDAGLQLEHVAHQLGDDLFQGRGLPLRQHAFPRAHIFSHNGPVLQQGVPHQPAGADAQEVVHSLRGVAGPGQLLLQGREGIFPETLVDAAVPVKALVADGEHVSLLLHKVLDRVALEVLDSLLTRPLALPLVALPGGEEAVDDPKQPLVLLVDDVNADIIFLFPLKFGIHAESSFAAGWLAHPAAV